MNIFRRPSRASTVSAVRTEIRLVGEFPYSYPLVQAQSWYLWPEESETPDGYPYPVWYDPWYRPWYYNPWYPYGYPYWR